MDMYVAKSDAAFIAKINVFIQFDGQLAVFAVLVCSYADVAVNQVIFAGCVADHIHGLVQLHSRAVTEVTGVLQAVVQGSYRFVINEDTGSRYTVYARCSVLAANRNVAGFTIFTIDTNLTVLAVFAVHDDGIYVDILSKLQIVNIMSVFCLGHIQIQVAGGVVYAFAFSGRCAFAYGHFSMAALHGFGNCPQLAAVDRVGRLFTDTACRYVGDGTFFICRAYTNGTYRFSTGKLVRSSTNFIRRSADNFHCPCTGTNGYRVFNVRLRIVTDGHCTVFGSQGHVAHCRRILVAGNRHVAHCCCVLCFRNGIDACCHGIVTGSALVVIVQVFSRFYGVYAVVVDLDSAGQSPQLRHIDRIGIFRTCGYILDLTGGLGSDYLSLSVYSNFRFGFAADGNFACCCLPSCRIGAFTGIDIVSSNIITGFCRNTVVRLGIRTDCHAVSNVC